jgi:hypothetical protein
VNNEFHLKLIVCDGADGIYLGQDRDQWRGVLNRIETSGVVF